METYTYHRGRDELMAEAIGWFSIGLGTLELVAPSAVARLAGIRDGNGTSSLVRTLGAREIGHGLAILSQPRSAARVWSRVGGDALDIAVVARALREESTTRTRAVGALISLAGVTVLDAVIAKRLGTSASADGRRPYSVRVQQAITINKPIETVYEFWRDFQNLPRFMRHLESVTLLGGRRSRWKATAPAGTTVVWDAEMIQDIENECIAWRSTEGSRIQNNGSVRFVPAPGARGTEIRVDLQYRPPAGAFGRAVALLFGEEPDQQVKDDLRRLKQIMETGEIALSEGIGMRPARPPSRRSEIEASAGVPR